MGLFGEPCLLPLPLLWAVPPQMKIMLHTVKFKALMLLKDRALIISCQSLPRHHRLLLSSRAVEMGCKKGFYKIKLKHKSPTFSYFSEREFTFTFAICRRPSSLCLSVCNVRAPYSGK